MNCHKRVPFVLAMILLFAAPVISFSQAIKGHLVIIGGGDETERSLERFVALAGGVEKARIVVLPMASSIPDTMGMARVKEFRDMGVRNAKYLLFDRAQALTKGFADTLNGATGIFLGGGDQSRLAAIVVGTPVQQKLKSLRAQGVVIGGTSAGAAIMSKVMITGNELVHKDSNSAFVSIVKGNIETLEGLGFLDNAIIDQHFIKRKRLNRLISIVLEHPHLLGIGIDEPVGVDVRPDGTFEVLGDGTVLVLDARNTKRVHTDGSQNLGARDISMHVLTGGERFDMRARKKR